MKERLMVDNSQQFPRAAYYVENDGQLDVGAVRYVTPETILNENRIIAIKEQVPESFEDLKDLCKQLDTKLVKEGALYETEITMEVDEGYYAFYKDGVIIFNDQT